MKRGKDEEKIMGPMFPRLHVNDTEKGGPRAPPRNKMALYEQLSIPSQRFNPAVMPLNHPNNPSNLVPPASSSQATVNERGIFFPPQLPPAEKARTRYADLNTPLVQHEQKKKPDEDDFSVPVFVQSGIGQQNNNNNNSNKIDRQRLAPFTPAYSALKLQRGNGEEPKRTETTGPQLRKQTNPASRYECTTNSFSRSQNTGESLQRGYGLESHSQLGNSIPGGTGAAANELPIGGVDYRNSSVPVRDIQLEDQRSPNDTNGDDVSEASMLDSISGIDISPDDVVGIIGQKHFWKARRAIVNQQRVFAVQVFELHRLMKVQRLIAGAPHLLLEDGAYLGKPLKATPAKKLPLEYIVKAPPKIIEQKEVSEKPNHTMECSAENAVGKASLSSVQNGSQPSNYSPFSSYPPPFPGNPPPTPSSNDSSKMGSWGFNQPPGHQWLIPVMTPSEGLVYKPYPGPGFMSPVCGGYGPPPGPPPVMGNFLNYGVPPPPPHHHYQGLGLAPFTPPPGHSYFPPFGMPVMNPAVSGLVSEQGLNGQLSGGGSTFNVPYQGSCNGPSQKNRDASNPVKPHPSKDSELQFSTASSPMERQGAAAATHVGGGAATDGRNALPLFPTSPAVQVPDGGGPQPREVDQAARVIKVVPHNARSATESVARIFQSIQEERKQYDSV